MEKSEIKEAENSALRIISYAPQSESKLYLKLVKKGFNKEIIETAIAAMRDYGYLNDPEYAKNWLQSRIKNKPDSKRNLFYGLLKQGIKRELAKKVIEENITEEIEKNCAKRIIEKLLRYKKSDKEQFKKKLYSKGFSSNIINDIFEMD